MVTEKIKQLADLKAKAAKLEASLEAQRPAALAALPAEFGFDSLAAFIKALKAASGRKYKTKKTGTAKAPKTPRRRKRVKITPEIKAAVKAATEAGRTGAAIAKELGISSASVQNVKKEFGLTKPRRVATPPA
jgi:DNA-binding NarL/FixJ family response regulator